MSVKGPSVCPPNGAVPKVHSPISPAYPVMRAASGSYIAPSSYPYDAYAANSYNVQYYAQHPAAPPPSSYPEDMIQDVWDNNLEAAFARIREIVVDFPYIAMDTEFPGVVARPVGNFRSNTEFYYQTLRCNVNLLKIIQLGITFADEHGNHPPGTVTWQFNFKFNLSDDIYAQDSIDLLAESGIDFQRFASEGIEVHKFAELLLSSGLVLQSDTPVKWLSFHAGYDYGYLIKILTDTELPADEREFSALMDVYFPEVFDIKYLLKQTGGRLSDMTGLSKLGDDLSVLRIGPAHQAGSDSLLTCHCFFKLKQEYFPGKAIEQFSGVLYGLGEDKVDLNMQQQQQGNMEPQSPGAPPMLQQQQAQQAQQATQHHPAHSMPPMIPVNGGHMPSNGRQGLSYTQQSYIDQVVYRNTPANHTIRNLSYSDQRH